MAARYLYGDRADEILARWTPTGGQAWHLADKQGTIRDVVDPAGAVIGHREYDAFGRIAAASGVVDRFAFQGREWEAAAGLYQFRARWYDPALRQFTGEDPLGFAAGDANLRRFVGNAPTGATDPSGRLALVEKAAILGGVAGAVAAGACALGELIARDDWTVSGVLEFFGKTIEGAAVGAASAALAVTRPDVAILLALGLTANSAEEPVEVPTREQKGSLSFKFGKGLCVAGKVVSIGVTVWAGGRTLAPRARNPAPQPTPQPTPANTGGRIPLPMAPRAIPLPVVPVPQPSARIPLPMAPTTPKLERVSVSANEVRVPQKTVSYQKEGYTESVR